LTPDPSDGGFSGCAEVIFRGARVEIFYQRTAADIRWWFADDGLNDIVTLPIERRAITAEALAHSNRGDADGKAALGS
jgi:hypothetical protein